jgi:hypothetical protein
MDMSFAFKNPLRPRQPRAAADYAALLALTAARQALSPTAQACFRNGSGGAQQEAGSASFHPQLAQAILNVAQAL